MRRSCLSARSLGIEYSLCTYSFQLLYPIVSSVLEEEVFTVFTGLVFRFNLRSSGNMTKITEYDYTAVLLEVGVSRLSKFIPYIAEVFAKLDCYSSQISDCWHLENRYHPCDRLSNHHSTTKRSPYEPARAKQLEAVNQNSSARFSGFTEPRSFFKCLARLLLETSAITQRWKRKGTRETGETNFKHEWVGEVLKSQLEEV